ncbi:type III-B CRISPR module RAMP protein Cmr1 [Candidatus Poribacteria bacterium]|nr:MAG: type III-B CRISPR module RAMP protein Cmr1 [Candidatus Poribacteria bacterium]
MKKTELNLETVTPMFLHGHDNKIVELRPPPFKALFRYWWRTVQDYDTDTLREQEAELFGSTDRKAPFSIRISGTTKLNIIREKPLPHKPDNDRLGFKMDAYEGGQSFGLHLITKSESDTCQYKQIAKLGFLLGGVGNRSRRGFGSIRDTSWNFLDVDSLRQEVLCALNAFRTNVRFKKYKFHIIKNGNTRTFRMIKSQRPNNSQPKYPVIQRIFFGELTNDVNELLKKIGKATSVAKRNNGDYTLGDGDPRMASPVIVGIQKINNQYLPVVTQLLSPYPNNQNPDNFEEKQFNFIEDIIK